MPIVVSLKMEFCSSIRWLDGWVGVGGEGKQCCKLS